MNNVTLDRINDLCRRRGINITRLEQDLGYGRGTIQKWKNYQPTLDKIRNVANYFNVSIDYLAGTSDIEGVSETLFQNETIMTLQRDWSKMTDDQKQTASTIIDQMLQLAFGQKFKDGDNG